MGFLKGRVIRDAQETPHAPLLDKRVFAQLFGLFFRQKLKVSM